LWDCLIVGGGPAGLSAAIYMGRFRRSTLVIDDAQGRWTYGQRTENYLGFPRGVSSRRLQALGKAQARRFGVEFEAATVERVDAGPRGFRLRTTAGNRRARTVVWAAGVEDRWPSFPGARGLVGRRLFWCLVCDGWRTRDRALLLLGDSAPDARTALQFLTYTSRITFLVDPDGRRLSRVLRARLEAAGISVLEGKLRSARKLASEALGVHLDGGRRLEADYIFSLLGHTVKTGPIRGLALSFSPLGHVRLDAKHRSGLSGFYAAGDVTDGHSHQVASAVHDGASAAQVANFDLYPPCQRLGKT
jgi:thioredoxin reductase (NADPH)